MALLFLLAFSLDGCAAQSNCSAAVKNSTAGVGGYIAQCDEAGNYRAVQCSGGTGYCWCADTVTGVKVNGTEARTTQLNCTTASSPPPASIVVTPIGSSTNTSTSTSLAVGPCAVKLINSVNTTLVGTTLVGAYVPQCDDKGYYSAAQCQGSTGYCWCVDTRTGETVPGSEVRFAVPTCSAATLAPAPTNATNLTALTPASSSNSSITSTSTSNSTVIASPGTSRTPAANTTSLSSAAGNGAGGGSGSALAVAALCLLLALLH